MNALEVFKLYDTAPANETPYDTKNGFVLKFMQNYSSALEVARQIKNFVRTIPLGIDDGDMELITAQGDYTGQVRGGRLNGRGHVIVPAGSYEGDFFENYPQGQGVMFTYDSKIKGQFLNGLPHGKCFTTKVPWEIFKSVIKDNYIDVRDCEKLRKLDTYEGEYAHGEFHGSGKQVLHSIASLSWGWIDGENVVKDSTEVTYKGQWSEGRKEGLGVLTCKEGHYYDGYWRADQRHGKGGQFIKNHKGVAVYEQRGRGGPVEFVGYRYEPLISEGEWVGDRFKGDSCVIS